MWLYFVIYIYILMWGLIFSTGKRSKSKQTAFVYITFGLFLILATLRSESIGNDTKTYIDLFNNMNTLEDLSFYAKRYEIGFLYLVRIIKYINNNPQLFIILTSSFVLLGIAKLIVKYSNNPWMSVFLFYTLGYFSMSMNTIRLNIAIVICLYSYKYLVSRKYIFFILYLFIAYLFHKTAIIFLFALPLTCLKISKRMWIGVIASSLIFYINFSFILNRLFTFFPIYSYYEGSTYLDGEIRLASIIKFFVGFVIIAISIYLDKNNQSTEANQIRKCKKSRLTEFEIEINRSNFQQFVMFGVIIIFLSFKFSLLSRVSDYFMIFSIIVLPNAILKIKNNSFRIVTNIIIIYLFFIYFTLIQVYRPYWNNVFPFEFFWQK